jgi:hypothetical protein
MERELKRSAWIKALFTCFDCIDLVRLSMVLSIKDIILIKLNKLMEKNSQIKMEFRKIKKMANRESCINIMKKLIYVNKNLKLN